MNSDERYREAIARFQDVYERARAATKEEPNAMTLATVDATGRPSARVMLLKEADERGFVFYTNHESRKGSDIAANPQVALCMYWPALMEQVRVEGRAAPVSVDEADRYWATRPRESQIGAWASRQSREAGGSEKLAERIARYEEEFSGREVPRPAYWSGYRVIPDRVEFWLGGDYQHRIHRRICYQRGTEGWTVTELDP